MQVFKLTLLIFISLNIYGVDFKILKYQKPIDYDYPEFSLPNIDNIGTFNEEVLYKKVINNEVIYEHVAHHNNYGFRVFLDLPKSQKDKHIIISGCSFSYGQGLEDQKTFSYKLAKKLPQFEIYNMGLLGGRIADQVYTWRVYDMKKYISQDNGIFIYTLIHDHLHRTNNDFTYLSWAKPQTPDYKFIDDDLFLEGSIEDNSKYSWIQFLKRNNLEIYWLRLVSHFRNFNKKGQISRLATELNILKKEYLKSFPNGRFVVSEIFPFPLLENKEDLQYLKSLLEKYNIEIWENNDEESYPPVNNIYSKFTPERVYTNYEIVNDGHPNELANDYYTEFLLKKLLINF